MLEEVDEDDEENGDGGSGKIVDKSKECQPLDEKSSVLFDNDSFDLNLFPRMYHLVFGGSTSAASTSGSSSSASSKFDTDSLIKCLTFEIKTYEHYEKYIVTRYMFWKYFSKLKTNFYCDSCSIILTSNRYLICFF